MAVGEASMVRPSPASRTSSFQSVTPKPSVTLSRINLIDLGRTLVEIWHPQVLSQTYEGGVYDQEGTVRHQNQQLHDSNEESYPTVSANHYASSTLGNNAEGGPEEHMRRQEYFSMSPHQRERFFHEH